MFLVILIHPFEYSGGYFFPGRLFWWILDINVQNFVRGFFQSSCCGPWGRIYLIEMFAHGGHGGWRDSKGGSLCLHHQGNQPGDQLMIKGSQNIFQDSCGVLLLLLINSPCHMLIRDISWEDLDQLCSKVSVKLGLNVESVRHKLSISRDF